MSLSLPDPHVFAAGCLLVAFLVSFASVRAAIAYAHRKGMLDVPGQRRSHSVPTPRGGGIGIVIGTLVGMPAALLLLPPSPGAGVPPSAGWMTMAHCRSSPGC
jgi:UDP-N-acetylmuramyl pentapeptide phosphotransferase/UDP-N-acetylglucosamine-1-phosphate transferase